MSAGLPGVDDRNAASQGMDLQLSVLGDCLAGLNLESGEVKPVEASAEDSDQPPTAVGPGLSEADQHLVEEIASSERCQSIVSAACTTLETANPYLKAAITLAVARRWHSGELTAIFPEDGSRPTPPVDPPRVVQTVSPDKVPRRKGGSEKTRLNLIHSLAHIECVAVDLSWDIIARFQTDDMPREFYDDWLKVAEDEARHFLLWSYRLKQLGCYYGELPTHSGLWDSAKETSHSIMARLAIEHMVLEARGLDVCPQTLSKFVKAGDHESASLLRTIYLDEITHVAAGVRWFSHLCARTGAPAAEEFHRVVCEHFKGALKPPFNDEARANAGMTEDWYLPLVGKNQTPKAKEASTESAPDK